MRKVINIFQTVSILMGFIVIALFLVPTIIGIKPFIVLSGSMEDTIKTGSIAYINTHVKAQDIQVGDIIAFDIENAQVTHRAIAINENNTFTTKGDANENEDLAPVKFENYKGKTIFSIPYVGKLITMCQTKTGHFIVFMIIGLNILCLIFSSDSEKSNKKQRNIEIDGSKNTEVDKGKNKTTEVNNEKQEILEQEAINNKQKDTNEKEGIANEKE